MTHCSMEPRTRKYVKWYGFLSFARNLSNKCVKKVLDTATKTELDAIEIASKKAGHKVTEAARQIIGKILLIK